MRRLLLMLLLFLPATASCSIIGSGSAGLPEVLATNTCEPPCWFGITPGETTHEEVLFLLPALTFIKQDSIKDWNNQTAALTELNSGASDVSLFYDTQQVVKVISIGTQVRKVSLVDVISSYGEPKKFLAVQGVDSRHGMRYKIIYTDRGMVFGGVLRPFDARKEQAVIKEDFLVASMYFFNPELLEQVFTDFSISGLLPEVFQSGLQDWQGFGEIDPVEEFPSR